MTEVDTDLSELFRDESLCLFVLVTAVSLNLLKGEAPSDTQQALNIII